MISGSVARRYAKALLQLGIAEQRAEAYGKELQQLGQLLAHRGLREVLENPVYPQSKRQALVLELLRRAQPSDTVARFVKLLNDRRRVSALPDIAREYSQMWDAHAGIVRAQVTSAQPLAPQFVEQLTAALAARTGKRVVVSQRTDPTLIGGVVTQIGSVVYDGSLRAQLGALRQQLLQH